MEQLRRLLLAKIDSIVNPCEETERIHQEAFGLFVGQYKPACFSSSGQHVLTAMEKGFEKLLVVLAECGCKNPNTLTVFQFYTWLENLDEKYEANKPPTHANKR